MGEEESVNGVSNTDSNGNRKAERILYDMTGKKDLSADGGKVLESNRVNDLKKDDVKDIAEDKKVDGVEQEAEDEKDNDVKEVEDDEKDDRVKVIKEDKKDNGVKETEEVKKDDGVKEMEEDKKDDVKEKEENKKDDNESGTEKLDEDAEVKETIESKDGAKEPEFDAMKEEAAPNNKDGTSEKDKIEEEEEDEDEVEVDKPKRGEKKGDSKVEKASKKRGKGKIKGEKVREKRKELKEAEPRTPTVDRPVRERKSVERLVASIEKDAAKEFHIEKGHGTPLKDIPNVAFKLSRRKTDDTFRLLHSILFGRRGKAVQIKSNISRFSGFVWRENEEKQMTKVKEKFDKCNKEKLLEFCDLLDIPVAKGASRKEDIIVKLMDFLVAPHATTTVLIAEKDKSNKGKKRKRATKRGSSIAGITTSKRSAKSQKRNEDISVVEGRKSTTDTEDESEGEEKEDEDNGDQNENGVLVKSEDEMPEQSESEDKNDSGSESEDLEKQKKVSKTSSAKKESAVKTKAKKVTVTNKSHSSPKRTSKKSSATRAKFDDDSDGSPKVFSRKTNAKGVKQKTSSLTKSASKTKTEKVTKGKGKNKEKLNPSDDQLRDVICGILKEVDFNTATFTDILKQLARQFDMDLTPRKASIKLMIQEELTKLADEADDEKDGEGDAEKDESRSADQEVEA